MKVLEYIKQLPEGYSEVLYNQQKYGVSKSTFNQGNSYKIYAEELGGTNFISLNYYITKNKELLKPCEMPSEKVIHFLQHYQIISND